MRITALALAAVFGLAACGEAEMDEVPETAEIEGIEETGALELEEEAVLGLDDVGEDIMATGWVVGLPLPNGFFLRTEDDRVVFVDTDASVQTGDVVRVMGPLAAAEAVVFEGWEGDAFDAGFEAEWDVETVVYIDAASVTPSTAPAAGAPSGQDTTPGDADAADTTATDGTMDRPAEDPGSKSG
jgi:hypothetical protein